MYRIETVNISWMRFGFSIDNLIGCLECNQEHSFVAVILLARTGREGEEGEEQSLELNLRGSHGL